MNHPKLTILRWMGRKLSVILLLAVSAAGAFATLGDGNKKSSSTPKGLQLSSRTAIKPGLFSLKSGYTYRGNEPISTEKKYFSLNTVVTLQKGNTTFVLPLKKKVLLDNIKIDLGNRQFKRN